MPIPEWPPRVADTLRAIGLTELYRWWQSFSAFFNQRLDTAGDVTISTAGKGIVMTNAAGTVTKRVRLNDAGNGLVYEDIS